MNKEDVIHALGKYNDLAQRKFVLTTSKPKNVKVICSAQNNANKGKRYGENCAYSHHLTLCSVTADSPDSGTDSSDSDFSQIDMSDDDATKKKGKEKKA